MTDIAAVLAAARPREHTIRVCVAGHLVAEVEQLEAALADIAEGWQAASLGDKDPRLALAEQVEAARERMRAAEFPFTFRALGDKAWSDLTAAHPDPEGKRLYNVATFPAALVAACCVDPGMSLDQVRELFEVINQGQRDELFSAAWTVNQDPTTIPFSLTASAVLAVTASK